MHTFFITLTLCVLTLVPFVPSSFAVTAPPHQVQKAPSEQAALVAEPHKEVVAHDDSDKSSDTHTSFDILLVIAIILIAARTSGIVERWGLPPVLGELLTGVFLGNLVYLGYDKFESMRTDEILKFMAEFGVIILLFQIGLESNIAQMKKVGMRALLVALVGVAVPFVLGTYIFAPYLLPESSSNTRLFLGAVLTATSVGITARVFKDLGKLRSKEAQIVLGAAVIDDVLGLVILAVVTAMVSTGSISFMNVCIILVKAIGFLIASIYLGEILSPRLSRLFSKIHRGTGMKFTVTVVIGLILSYFAALIGLAPIIGAFAAGLVLDAVHFHDYHEPDALHEVRVLAKSLNEPAKADLLSIVKHHSHRHVEELIAPLGYFFVPIFFVMTGFQVDLASFLNPQVLLIAGGISIAAILGKLAAGLAAGQVNKLVVGVGMIPRGEVGLIFASAGKLLGVVDSNLYSAIVVMVIVTTLATPPCLSWLLRKKI